MRCTTGLTLKSYGSGSMKNLNISGRVRRIEFRRFDVFGVLKDQYINPGDIASRRAKSFVIASSDPWCKGAPFLENKEAHWPNLPNCPVSGNAVPEETERELQKESAPKISRVTSVSVQFSQTFQK